MMSLASSSLASSNCDVAAASSFEATLSSTLRLRTVSSEGKQRLGNHEGRGALVTMMGSQVDPVSAV